MKRLHIHFMSMLIILGLLIAPGCKKGEGVTKDEILIGSFQALSGPIAVIGIPVAEGLNAYFNSINNTFRQIFLGDGMGRKFWHCC